MSEKLTRCGGPAKCVVEGHEFGVEYVRQLEVAGVVDRQPVLLRQMQRVPPFYAVKRERKSLKQRKGFQQDGSLRRMTADLFHAHTDEFEGE